MQGIVGPAWASTVWADIVACTGVEVHGYLSEHEMHIYIYIFPFLPHYHSTGKIVKNMR